MIDVPSPSRLSFDEETHRYFFNGRQVPSVTRITGVVDKSGALLNWALRLMAKHLLDTFEAVGDRDRFLAELTTAYRAPRQNMRAKGDLGTRFHLLVQEFIRAGTMPDTSEEHPFVSKCVQEFHTWRDRYKPDFTFSEMKLVSDKHLYAGTADAGVFIEMGDRKEKKHVLVDFKTSGGIYPEYLLQAAAYAKAYEEQEGTALDGIMIAKFPNLEVVYREDVDKLFDAFLGARKLYDFLTEEGAHITEPL